MPGEGTTPFGFLWQDAHTHTHTHTIGRGREGVGREGVVAGDGVQEWHAIL